MDKQLEKSHGTLFLYMITAARLLYAQRWKDSALHTMEEWLVKMMELAEMAKLTSLIREKTITMFTADWKPLIAFLPETEKNAYDLWF